MPFVEIFYCQGIFFHIFMCKTNTEIRLSVQWSVRTNCWLRNINVSKLLNMALKCTFWGQNMLKHKKLILCAKTFAYFYSTWNIYLWVVSACILSSLGAYTVFPHLRPHSMTRANLDKSKKVLKSNTTASKYISKRPRIWIN